MLIRNLVTCRSCEGMYILRYGVGLGFEQRLAWPCPICNAETRAHLSVKQKDIQTDLKSDDITVHAEAPTDLALPGVNIYSELPVHNSSIGKGLSEGGSAWLFLPSLMTGDDFMQFADSKEAVQLLRSEVFPAVRRAASHAKVHDWHKLKANLANTPVAAAPEVSDRHPAYQFGRLLDLCFIPILELEKKVTTGQEVMILLNRANLDCPHLYTDFLDSAFSTQAFGGAANRCIDLTLRLFSSYDALILPLATELLKPEWRDRLDEFRVYRDDFDLLKGLYQDIYESMNQLLLWLGMLANLVNRGDTDKWFSGGIASFKKARSWRAVDREFIITELSECKSLFDKASRSLRNEIGHFQVQYDVIQGDIVLSDGKRSSLLIYHEDLLAAARLLSVLITFSEKMTLDYLRLVRHEPMSGWSGR